MHKDWQNLYFGLGSFEGLEPQSTENNITILNRITLDSPTETIKLKGEALDLYYAYLEASHAIGRKKP